MKFLYIILFFLVASAGTHALAQQVTPSNLPSKEFSPAEKLSWVQSNPARYAEMQGMKGELTVTENNAGVPEGDYPAQAIDPATTEKVGAAPSTGKQKPSELPSGKMP
jgi:hypothetical protein